jgi:hypothetical protein
VLGNLKTKLAIQRLADRDVTRRQAFCFSLSAHADTAIIHDVDVSFQGNRGIVCLPGDAIVAPIAHRLRLLASTLFASPLEHEHSNCSREHKQSRNANRGDAQR